MKSIENNFDNPIVNTLLHYHFYQLRSNSPEGSTHVLDIEGLKVPSIKFWSIWEEDKLIGCGALKFLEKNHGEFKSIRIADEFRGKGYGIKLLDHLIIEAKKNAAAITPVPGGVGPMTIACLLRNTTIAFKNS